MAPHAEESVGTHTGHEDVQHQQENERNMPKPGEYIQFDHLPAGGPLNRWSHFMTRDHDYPGAQASLFALYFSQKLPNGGASCRNPDTSRPTGSALGCGKLRMLCSAEAIISLLPIFTLSRRRA
ncbi:uncharacterized protein PODANS_7_660 [Podospora anserina S mat+]|uniref:Podospora anserina S mat+ genomic DNA chromosome 7, supercontig 3 n=1 Tax=Podospora anserina (strain S / ATCC MYA-4624 / DSM 980 / FGSC 10383) TaxID=515849 RepID=B2AP38_PODAN|nr:uncharacterized protein PODANS_7_660 [Podospora anserina S mat+]CAP65732.1 unnamed protein product [Podospora anserina S mat+]